ncbi:DUF4304 domain-containing protein [Cohaesibacter gelatinilyticus]|uniref:DUF4304 domain-containing protein n=1 Tax=Cohaesibacter gelatinilyticus TaxID=372072 RepID=A0A285PHC4_9HYPH|nr:DUF4304 domain-containing protein [Cohaesibacter gelatinilyticus]SNZ21129.1 protein of unknown function [Cohaesibacter gelatinilyticus]
MIDQIVSQYIAKNLKANGFKKKRLTWNKRIGEYVQVVNVQKSQWNTEEDISFTINWGISFDYVYQALWGKSPPLFISETDSFPRFRVGNLPIVDKKLSEIWWNCDPDTGIEPIGAEIIKQMEEVILPNLEKLSNYKEICNLYALQTFHIPPIEKVQLATILHSLGKYEEAETLFDEVSSYSDSHSTLVSKVQKRLHSTKP